MDINNKYFDEQSLLHFDRQLWVGVFLLKECIIIIPQNIASEIFLKFCFIFFCFKVLQDVVLQKRV